TYVHDEENSCKNENEALKISMAELKAELMRYKIPPLLVAEVLDVHPERKALILLKNSNEFYVHIDRSLEGNLQVGDEVLVEQKSLTIVQKIGKKKHFDVNKYVIIEKPNIKWGQIGGLNDEIEEIKEVIELPLKKPELFRKIGIEPPKGVLLYGPPGTGKTLLAKAVATSTNTTFIEIVGSELVQKFIGQGAKLVKSIFQMAKEKAPSIIFIDEIDSIAATRVDVGTSGEREVQRTFMQLLAEIDGFTPLGDVKLVAATNRIDIVDPAITRPGRFDRLVFVPAPDHKGIIEIFKIHTKNMKLADDVNIGSLAKKMKDLSGAEVRAVCIEAGYFAIRRNDTNVSSSDFKEAITKIKGEEEKKIKDLSYLG
ncbi:MAG: AAA family ATPase, partial [archaeon]|nr:AAA family ATPase [archaeon]